MPPPEFSRPNFLVGSVQQQWLRLAGFARRALGGGALDKTAA
jgi:hypothetical protein